MDFSFHFFCLIHLNVTARSHCDGNDTTNQFLSVIQCHHGMRSAPNCDSNSNKIGIMATGDGVHTMTATENKKMILLPPANVVGKGYVFTSVCLSTGGCGFPACLTGHMTRQ